MKEDNSSKADAVLKYFGAGLLLVGIIMGVCFVALRAAYPDISERGAFGDQFGVVNTLVTGVGFFGIVMSILLQSRDLTTQTEALKVQQEAIQQQILEFQEQKKEMRRSAEAQEKAAKAQDRANELAVRTLQFEAVKQRLSFAMIRYQQAGAERSARADAHGLVLELINQLEEMAKAPPGRDHWFEPTTT